MASRRLAGISREATARIAEGYTNFTDGLTETFALDATTEPELGRQVRRCFNAAYPLIHWCEIVRHVGDAKFFLVEIRSAMPVAIALAAKGIYESAHIQLRYLSECFVSFLFFRDHPRELELALLDADQWDRTRPKAATTFLRKLPEFAHPEGKDFFNRLDAIYGELSQFVHPRRPDLMGQRRYLADMQVELPRIRAFARATESLASAACGLLFLGCQDEYVRASEVDQFILTKPIRPKKLQQLKQHLART